MEHQRRLAAGAAAVVQQKQNGGTVRHGEQPPFSNANCKAQNETCKCKKRKAETRKESGLNAAYIIADSFGFVYSFF
jgi:hypothetical protein